MRGRLILRPFGPFLRTFALGVALLAPPFILSLNVNAQGSGQVGFVPGTEDIPLMPGLSADSEAPLLFDAPPVRIIQSILSGRLDEKEVRAFYQASLPQLGWKQDGDALRWDRQGEHLVIKMRRQDGRLLVSFEIAPSAAP
jgi:hypothetical protein